MARKFRKLCYVSQLPFQSWPGYLATCRRRLLSFVKLLKCINIIIKIFMRKNSFSFLWFHPLHQHLHQILLLTQLLTRLFDLLLRVPQFKTEILQVPLLLTQVLCNFIPLILNDFLFLNQLLPHLFDIFHIYRLLLLLFLLQFLLLHLFILFHRTRILVPQLIILVKQFLALWY